MRLAFLAALLLPAFAHADNAAAPADQRDYADSANGCAPATLLNFLRFGGPEHGPVLKSLVGATDGVRMRFLVDRYYRHRPSTGDRTRMRWGVHGIRCEDFADGIGELFAEHGLAAPSSAYLDREGDESEAEHLARVHGMMKRSLAAGTPPILNLRSFLVKRREKNDDEPRWETATSHYVLVTAVSDAPPAAGFEISAIDPWKGRRTVLYLHREANGRAFLALKGDEETGEWLEGRPFLQVLAPEVPTLRPANLEWSERYLVVANHLIGRF